VILKAGEQHSADLQKILVGHVRNEIGPIASPDHIHFVPELPKTRSGKIMRRILRKVAAGERDMDAFGDISTLADPSIVQTILDTAPDA
jgi:acetyl-CoA synthetase